MKIFEKVKDKINSNKRLREIEKKVKSETPITQSDLDFYNSQKNMEELIDKIIVDRLTNFRKFSEGPSLSCEGLNFYKNTAVIQGKDLPYIKIEDISECAPVFDEAIKTEGNEVITTGTSKGGFGLVRAGVGAVTLGPAGALLGFTKKKKNKNKTVTKKGKETPILKDIRVEIQLKNGMSYKYIIAPEMKDTNYNREKISNKFNALNDFFNQVFEDPEIPPRSLEEYRERVKEPFSYILEEWLKRGITPLLFFYCLVNRFMLF